MNKAYKYGIELELVCPTEYYDRVSNGMRELKNVVVDSDGSIRHDYGVDGMELKIGVLGFQALERKVSKVAQILKTNECSVNNSCGFHLHMSNKRFKTRKYLKRIIHTWLAIEDFMVALQPQSRLNNSYCMRLLARKIAGNSLDNLPAKKDRIIDHLRGFDRYHALNLQSLHAHGTIENRLHSATLDKDKIINWVKLQKHFYNYCLVDYNPQEVNNLMTEPISEDKIKIVFDLLKADKPLRDFYTMRVHKMLFTHLKQQNLEALKVIEAKKIKEKVLKKYQRYQAELDAITQSENDARRLFRNG